MATMKTQPSGKLRRADVTNPDGNVTVSAPDSRVFLATRIVEQADRERLAAELLDAGLKQEQIAARLGMSQATMHRLAKQIRADGLRPLSPIEVIACHVLDRTTHEAMLKDLLSRRYTRGTVPHGSYDGYRAGSWDEVPRARSVDLLSEPDLARLASRAPLA